MLWLGWVVAPAGAADCGGLLQPACPAPPPTSVPQPTPQPEPEPAPVSLLISDAQYAALDRVLKAGVKLDGDPSSSQLNDYLAACERLGGADSLLAEYRAACRIDYKVTRRSREFSRCRAVDTCRRRGRALQDGFRGYAAALRRLNVVVDRKVDDRRCRNAIRVTQHVLRTVDQFGALLPDFIRAPLTRTRRDDAAVERRFKRIDFAGSRTNQQQHVEFRAFCR